MEEMKTLNTSVKKLEDDHLYHGTVKRERKRIHETVNESDCVSEGEKGDHK